MTREEEINWWARYFLDHKGKWTMPILFHPWAQKAVLARIKELEEERREAAP